MGSIYDIGTPGNPLNTPPLTVWQQAVYDVLGGSDVPVDERTKASSATKAADQAGIASGGSAGFTASLSGVRVGQIILAIISNAFITNATTTSYTQHLPTGMSTLVSNPVPPTTGGTTVSQHTVVLLYAATATTVSLGYSVTTSNAGAWTAKAQSSIYLIAL